MDGWVDRQIHREISSLLRTLSATRQHIMLVLSISGFPCMFADCLMTSLGFGTHTLQIHDHPSHYLHIFPLRIIMAFTTTAHILMSCRPGHTEVIIYWKLSWWASIVCTISSSQGRWGDCFFSIIEGLESHVPIFFYHRATQDPKVFPWKASKC